MVPFLYYVHLATQRNVLLSSPLQIGPTPTPSVGNVQSGLTSPIALPGNNLIDKFLYQLPGWPNDNLLLSFVLVLLVWSAIAALAYWLLFSGLRAIVRRTPTDLDNMILSTLRVPILVAIISYGVISALAELDLKPNIAGFVNTLYNVVLIAAGFYLLWRILKEVVLKWLLRRAKDTETKVDDLLVPIINTLGPFLFFIVASVFILEYLGVDVGFVALSVGAVSLVLGLAFQDTLSNLFSGISLMLDPPFHEGDLITLDGGKVYSLRRVGLRMTELYDMNSHAMVYMPNSHLTNSTITNVHKPTSDSRVAVSVQTPRNVDPDRVESVLSDVLWSQRDVLGDAKTKLEVLQKRIEQVSTSAGAPGDSMTAALQALNAWYFSQVSRDNEMQKNLLNVRTEMSYCLDEATAALQQLPAHHGAVKELATVKAILEGLDADAIETEEEGLLSKLAVAVPQLAGHFSAQELAPLTRVLSSVEDLQHREGALETALEELAQASEKELDSQLNHLGELSERAAEALRANDHTKEASRIAIWTNGLAVVYVHLQVYDSLEGLDLELGELILWLGKLEAGGLSTEERNRIRGLFGQWGGINVLQKRRIAELRRRIMYWLQQKEEQTLEPQEYADLSAFWDRKLRLLSSQLRSARGSDEEMLDSRLAVIRDWMHTTHFIERLPNWKMPGAGFDHWEGAALLFNLDFYVDNVGLEHFSRKERVKDAVLKDVFETFKREGIEISA